MSRRTDWLSCPQRQSMSDRINVVPTPTSRPCPRRAIVTILPHPHIADSRHKQTNPRGGAALLHLGQARKNPTEQINTRSDHCVLAETTTETGSSLSDRRGHMG